MKGRFGFVSLNSDEEMKQGYLLAGTELTCGNSSISIPKASVSLSVDMVQGKSFVCAEPVPGNPDHFKGNYILAGDTGFEI